MILLGLAVYGIVCFFQKREKQTIPSLVRIHYPFFAIDVETANKNKNSICSIAIAWIENNKVYARQWYVKPPTTYFEFTYLHNITYDMVKDMPTFDIVWTTKIAPLVKSKFLAAHYAHFDMKAIDDTLRFYNLSIRKNNFIIYDSCIASREAFPKLPNHKLNTVCSYLQIPLDHHDALSDVMACANILNIINTKCPRAISSMLFDQVTDKQMYNSYFFK